MSSGTFVDPDTDQAPTDPLFDPDPNGALILCVCGTVTEMEAYATSERDATATWSFPCRGCGENVTAEWDYYKGP